MHQQITFFDMKLSSGMVTMSLPLLQQAFLMTYLQFDCTKTLSILGGLSVCAFVGRNESVQTNRYNSIRFTWMLPNCVLKWAHFWHLFHTQQTAQTLNRTRYLFYFMSVAFQFRRYFYAFSTLKRTVFLFSLFSHLLFLAMCAPTAHILVLFIPVPIFHLIFSPIKCFVFMRFVVVGGLSVFVFGCRFSLIIIIFYPKSSRSFGTFSAVVKHPFHRNVSVENWKFLHFPWEKY